MKQWMVKTENLKKYYKLGNHTVKALDGINFLVEDGEFVSIIGKSGSGKSTLLHLIGGLDTPTEGKVWIGGRDLSGIHREKLAVFRRRNIGFVFQNYNLVPDLNIYENIILPSELDGASADEDLVEEVLRCLKLQDKREAMPNTLSGGQQQRAAIARALVMKPLLVLADEPTGNLDTETSHDVIGLLKTMAKRFQQTLVVITHDQDIAQMADRIVHMRDGKIIKG